MNIPLLAPKVRSCANVRDLGGHVTPDGLTQAHRFLRCGGTRSIVAQDLETFRQWGVRRVLDLRSPGESPELTCSFARQDWIAWHNVALFDYDLSAPTMVPATNVDSYLVTSYLHILTSCDAIREAFEYCAGAQANDCVLFHCAAGMDRTGVLAMLILGLVGASREDIVADYALSFGTPEQVADTMRGKGGDPSYDLRSFILHTRINAACAVYDTIVATHGSIRSYLEYCDISRKALDAVRTHLLA